MIEDLEYASYEMQKELRDYDLGYIDIKKYIKYETYQHVEQLIASKYWYI